MNNLSTEENQAKQLAGGHALAVRLSAELVGCFLFGALLGWLVDSWLNSKPWGLIIGFFIGAITGMYGVYKTAVKCQQEYNKGNNKNV